MPPEKEPASKSPEKTSPAPGSFIQFKIVLKDVRPPVWRRFLVPEEITLYKLHCAIQDVMGWWDYHLHEFIRHGKRYGVPDPDFDWGGEPLLNDKRIRLSDLGLSLKDKMIYAYDFGDGWEHELLVEKILPPPEGIKKPVCLKGARSCPPEDCGGPWGYENLLEILKDPEHEEYESMKTWLPEGFDSESFDLDLVNRMLSSRQWKSPPRKDRKKSS